MAVEVIMPKLGMGMQEGTVIEWRKAPGDPVRKGEPVVVISSEKIEMDIEAQEDGVLLEILVPEGEAVPVGTVIGRIGEAGEKQGDGEGKNLAQNLPERSQKGQREVKISPVARRLAKAAGLDIRSLTGTGPDGRITKEDVEKAIAERSVHAEQTSSAEQTSPAEQGEEAVHKIPVAGMRKVIATRMHESLLHSAQLTLTLRADVTDLLKLKEEIEEEVNRRYQVKVTITDFVARAVVLSLLQHRAINSAWIDDRIHTYDHIHLGIAVALEKGLVVPVIRNAEKRTFVELAKEIKTLRDKARAGALSHEEMRGSTFTVTNLGAYGIETFTPILNPPEAGILGVGCLQDQPVYIGAEWLPRRLLPLSLTFDHRVLDGAPAARFLSTVKNYLEEPYKMLL